MQSENKKSESFLYLFFLVLAGLVLPFLLVACVPSYHQYDLDGFRLRADCWGRNIYLACQNLPNYPSLGVALGDGAFHVIKSLSGTTESRTLDDLFRYYLAFFDALNFLLFVWLAKLMKFRFPLLIGLFLLIMPSTRIGGSLWGQTDGIVLLFGLFSAICFFKSWSPQHDQKKGQPLGERAVWLLLGAFSLALHLLTKQLAIFSLPFFALLVFIAAQRFWQAFRVKGVLCVFSALLVFGLSFHSLDGLLEVPTQFHNSSYWFVWKTGSNHADIISANGFNIWVFLGRNGWSSSHVPFATLAIGSWKYAVSPYGAGIFLYLFFIAFLLVTAIKSIVRILKMTDYICPSDKQEGYLLALLCFFYGLSQLGFNVLLCGTHERYLYLGYPLLLIAVLWFYTRQMLFSRGSLLLCFFAALIYGGFVLSVLTPLPPALSLLGQHEFLAFLHLFLLLFLLRMWGRLCRIENITAPALSSPAMKSSV
jgi:hypothetical protein